ncbi:MAG: PcfJ domain-containing protein [Ferrovibrio sp.]|uniref:PcfJ domain-containing protein n=1 Tax=Ferrovibrio sp. TaxID=1917215 RepID=UPI002607D025|nr:PcfJ domain-containing protein [Ferrovibrio sp.]MCW0234064.1 PcfJ domain-containing protein [Ferrovibrio sp.]
MTALTWTSLKRLALRKVAKACPEIAEPNFVTGLDPVVAIVALASVRLVIGQQDGSTEVRLDTRPVLPADEPVTQFLSQIVKVINDHVRISGQIAGIDFSDWLDRNGFPDIIVNLLSKGFDEGEVSAFADTVGTAVGMLTRRIEELGQAHRKAILARDLPQASCGAGSLPPNAVWLLAIETSGEPRRPEILKRRLQAFQLYDALPTMLRDLAITEIIDEGRPLAPAIMQRTGLSAPELKALRQSRTVDRAIGHSTDFERAIEELKAYSVPLHEWPGEGRPGQAYAWETSPWVKRQRSHLIRLDYLDEEGTSVQDAVNALRDDLLRPLASERLRVGGLKGGYRLTEFARDFRFDVRCCGAPDRRDFLAALHRAIIGARKPRAFRKAVDLWHRRAASLAALRHEGHADKPGWPALCAPWRSGCGRYEVVALISASDLVEEGNKLDHCVGGYYETCRKGDVHILSLREDGKRVATVEIRLGEDLANLTLHVGQFKAHRNSAPPPHLHDVLRDFLKALRTNVHPVNADRLARYRRHMRDTYDGSWRSDALPLDHARQAYPLYLPLLPRGAPATFDEWSEQSGLAETFDKALRLHVG